MTDWDAIRREYINGTDSYRLLAEKHGANYDLVRRHAAKEKWSQQRKEVHSRVAEKTQKAAEEKMVDSLSEVAAIQSRVRLKLMQMIEKSVPTIDDEDVDKLRKLVSAYKDMCEIAGEAQTESEAAAEVGIAQIPAVLPKPAPPKEGDGAVIIDG